VGTFFNESKEHIYNALPQRRRFWRVMGTWRSWLRLSSFGVSSPSILTFQAWQDGVTCTTNNCRRVLNLIHRPTSLLQLVTAVKDNRILLRLSGHNHAIAIAAAAAAAATAPVADFSASFLLKLARGTLHFLSQLLELGECVVEADVVPALIASWARPFSAVIL
jgi:hypothetical protein